MRKLSSGSLGLSGMALVAIALTAAAPSALSAADDENIWTWMNGPSSADQELSFGTQGVAAPSNSPGGRYYFASAADPDGKFWVFGGYSRYNGGSLARFDDLWQFDPSTAEWTWMKGSTINSTKRVSGTQGVSSPANTPGFRRGAVLWCDNAGMLWLFGGEGYIEELSGLVTFSDLWKFDPQTREWTWVKGHYSVFQPPVYGTMGQPDPANTPGARYYASGVKDSTGALWLFGGAYPGGTAYNNGLWRFTPNDENWTWIKGEDLFGTTASYGSTGLESPTNTPGGRKHALLWADQSGGIWMFGGYGPNALGFIHEFSDLWKLNTANGNWAFIKGSKGGDAPSVYGPPGVGGPDYSPGARLGASGWTDTSGNLWLFGGPSLNDLWNYSPTTGNWAWVGGGMDSSLSPNYGVIGVPSSTNIPGSRYLAGTWNDNAGNFWLFGGDGKGAVGGAGLLGDVWRFKPGAVQLPSSASMWSMYE